MIRGLILKTLHEVWLATLLFGLAILLVLFLLTYILPQLESEIRYILGQLPFVKSMLSALLGIDVQQEMTVQMLQAFVWVHPVVLSLLWAHELIFCSRFPAAEIDRGTIDLLLGQPVARRTIFVCDSLMWLATGVVLLSMGLCGYLLSARLIPADSRPPVSQLWAG